MPRLHVADHYIRHVVLYRLTFFSCQTRSRISLLPIPEVRLGTRPQGNEVSYFLNLDFVLVFIG